MRYADRKARTIMPLDPDQRFLIELGRRIADHRQTAGLTQSEVGSLVGLSQQTMNSVEKGRRRLAVSALMTMAEVFGVTLDQLVTGAAPPFTRKTSALDRRLDQQVALIRRLPNAKRRVVVDLIEAALIYVQRR